jgi:hypothetical protein
VVPCLLGHPSVATTTNCRRRWGDAALWVACFWGRGAVARLVLDHRR